MHSTLIYVGPCGISKEHQAKGIAYHYPIFCHESLDENIVYATTKAIAEGYDIYSLVHKMLKDWTLEMALAFAKDKVPNAYHKGAVKYFKEIGKWTPEMEAWQQKILKDEAKRIAAWEKSH